MKRKMLEIFYLIVILLDAASCTVETGVGEHGINQPIVIRTGEIPDSEDLISKDQISGFVLSEDGKTIEYAIVRLQTTEIFTLSKKDGSFLLEGVPVGEDIRITAFSPGYYINEADVVGGMGNITIQLTSHNLTDNSDYIWLSAGVAKDRILDGVICADCHTSTDNNTLPFDEWRSDAHALSGENPRFLSMFNGTDISGNQSPLTTYVIHRDYGRLPIRPSAEVPYYGPGFLLDFPESAGNCAACHLPLAAVDAPYNTNPNDVVGIAKEEGINCDFCHKIWDVKLDLNSSVPFSNMPGVISLEFLRPPEDHQLFIGPLDDVAPGEDTYSPLQNQSQFCAACHFGDFWGVQIYNSFGEWLDSSYSDPDSDNFQTCQDCHMPPSGNDHFAQIEPGGLIRDPATIFSHKMLGASDIDLLQNTAELEAESYVDGNQLFVDVKVTNSQAGHHIPTDSPLRQILLVVEVIDQIGEKLVLSNGPVLPDWAGDLANEPGKYYAKILEQLWTELSPTGAYWSQTRLVEDTRLAALETDESFFIFELPDDGREYSISVKLIYRRAFFELMEQKSWDTPDIEIEIVTLVVGN